MAGSVLLLQGVALALSLIPGRSVSADGTWSGSLVSRVTEWLGGLGPSSSVVGAALLALLWLCALVAAVLVWGLRRTTTTSAATDRAWGGPALFLLGSLAVLLGGRWFLRGLWLLPGVADFWNRVATVGPQEMPPLAWTALALHGVAFLLATLTARHVAENSTDDASLVPRWLRFSGSLCLVAALVPTLTLLPERLPTAVPLPAARLGVGIAARLWTVLALVWALELLVRTLREALAGNRAAAPFGWHRVARSPLTALLFRGAHPLASLFRGLSDWFGIDLQSAWALAFVRRALAPLAVVLLGLGWLSSAVQQVDTAEQALRFRLGRLVSTAPLEPGLHLGWPWPVDRLRRAPVYRTQQLSLGYAGQSADTSLLWTSRHATEEYSLLLGNGNDLVAINGLLAWRVREIHRYLLDHQNAERNLRLLADRALLQATQRRSLSGVLSENLQRLAADLRRTIQREADSQGLGIDVLELSLIGLHPPVDVAADYQAVVGSEIKKQTIITEGLGYREETLPGAMAQGLTAVAEADGFRATRLARAVGEAAAFDAIEGSYRVSPRLFEFRKRLEHLEQALKERPFVLVDDRIERDGGSLWILD